MEGRTPLPERSSISVDKVFVDTNILVYAHDVDEGQKHLTARTLVEEIWQAKTGVVSLQVLQEFFVILTRKIKSPLSLKAAKNLLELYGSWEVMVLDVEDLLAAIDVQSRHHFSFWDSLIVQAAALGECSWLISEDFQHDQRIGKLKVRNPFLSLKDSSSPI